MGPVLDRANQDVPRTLVTRGSCSFSITMDTEGQMHMKHLGETCHVLGRGWEVNRRGGCMSKRSRATYAQRQSTILTLQVPVSVNHPFHKIYCESSFHHSQSKASYSLPNIFVNWFSNLLKKWGNHSQQAFCRSVILKCHLFPNLGRLFFNKVW